MLRLQKTSLTAATLALCVLASGLSAQNAQKDEPWKLNPIPERLNGNPGQICAEEGGRLYGIPPESFKTVSVQRQQGGEGKTLVRLSVGKEWYACTLDRLHGLVDFRGGG